MAKKKRKADNRKQHSHKAGYPKGSPAVMLINQAKQCFNEQCNAARANPNIDKTIFEGLDYDPVRQKRRIQAVIGTLDKVKALAGDPSINHPEVFTVESEWININTFPLAGYDLEERFAFSTFAAAIWILDQLKAADRVHAIETEMIPIEEDVLPMPSVWDICHSTESLEWMMNAIYTRHRGHKENKSGNLLRFYMTDDIAKGSIKRSRSQESAYETILSHIPEEVIRDAVARYEKVYWDWTRRYFKSRILLAQMEDQYYHEELQLNSGRENILQVMRGNHGPEVNQLVCNTKSGSEIFEISLSLPQNASATCSGPMLGESRDMVLRRSILDQSLAETQRKIEQLWHYVGLIPQWPYEHVSFKFGEEIAQIWKDFDAGDPYEMAFALICLLDRGSDLPWCYFPGTNLHAACVGKLPWTRTRFNPWNDGIYYHYDQDASAIKLGPADSTLPKRIQVPEMENWYQPQYTSEGTERPEMYNLAQIMYEITGCIMPRNLDRYLPALKTLDQYGIKGKGPLHILLYCMTLLGEARHRTNGSYTDLEIEEEQEVEPEQNQCETIEMLLSQIKSLKAELKRQTQQAYDNAREAQDMRARYEASALQTANEIQELHDLRELFFHQQEGTFDDQTSASQIDFPYTSGKRIVVFGGHESWAREIKPKLPNIRFVDRTMAPNANLIRNADVIWIQPNALCHPHFYKIVDESKKYNIPIRYFSYSSPIKCAEQLVDEDRKYR